MRLNPLEEKIAKLVQPVVESMGLELFTVQQSGEGGGLIIQVMVENKKTGRLGMDDCSRLSRAIGAVLDVEDPITSSYRLEVSSPGVDRLLLKREDYAEYLGMDVKIEIDPPIEGQKRFRGRIEGMEGDEVLLKTDNGPARLPFPDIQKAKLVMSDELIKAGQKKFKELQQTTEGAEEEQQA